MKKIRLLSALIVILGLTLSACGSSDKETSKEKTDGIIWAGWSGEEDSTKKIVNEMIDSFNEESDKKVSWVGWPWADTQQQLIIRNQGSEVLDVAQVDIGMFGALSDMGILEDFNELIGKDELANDYEESALSVGQIDGQQLGMPWSIASIGMLYNPTLLKEVGYNEPPKTIAEFEDCMKKIKEKNPDVIPYGIATKEATMATDFQPWLWTFGASILDDSGKVVLDSDKAKEATTWYKDLLADDLIQMNITRFDARQMFAEGKMAFYDDAISARGIAMENGVEESQLSENIQSMSRPVLKEGDDAQSAMWGHLLVVFKKSTDKEAAVNLVKHIVSKDQSLNYLESNGMPPVLKEAVDSEEVKNDQWVDQWLGFTSTGKTLEFALNSNSGELNNILVEELQAILGDEKSINDGLSDAKTRIEQAQSE